MHRTSLFTVLARFLVLGALWGAGPTGEVRVSAAGPIRLLNVSFDISRELFGRINPAFAAARRQAVGEDVTLQQSHGGSSKQARAVIDGLEADVVTFNQVTDVDMLVRRGGLVPENWRDRLPHRSSPFTSTIVFVVRPGNPKAVRDWSDLAKPGVGVVVPNPKTSGNGRYGYLAAWAYAQRKLNLNETEARDFVARVWRNVPVFDTGGRGATTSFVERGLGDVLLTFEAEAFLARDEFGAGRVEIVWPTFSVEAEMPVTVVDKVARRHGTEGVARAYLEFLFTEPAQEIIAGAHFRPRSAAVARRHAAKFGNVELVGVDEAFGSWEAAMRTHFGEDGVLDQITRSLR